MLAAVIFLIVYSLVTTANNATINEKNIELSDEITKVFLAEQRSQANFQLAQTREAEALANADLAATREVDAQNNADEAQANLELAQTREAEAISERKKAERQSRIILAQSLLAQASTSLNRDNDVELAAILSIEASTINEREQGDLQAEIDSALREVFIRSLLQFDIGKVIKMMSDRFALSPDQRFLASGSHDSTVRLWDLGNLSMAPTILTGESNWIRFVAFDPSSQVIAASGDDGQIRLWDLHNTTAPPTLLLDHQEWVSKLVFQS